MIHLTQEWMLYLLIFLVIPFLLSIRSYIFGLGGYAFLNRSNIEVLKGISIVWIILCNICSQLAYPSLIINLISKTSILGMALLLFTSGFELMMKYLTQPNYLKGFLLHQVIRISCLFLGCNVIGALVNIFMGSHDTLIDVLNDTVKFQFVNQTSASLIGILLYFYVAFYISYRTKLKLPLLGFLSLIFIAIGIILKWEYSLAFCFFIGVFFAKYKKYCFNLLRQYLGILFSVSLVLFSSCYLLYMNEFEFIFPFIPYLFLVLIICALMKLQLRSTVFKVISIVAVEFYLVHELLIVCLRYSRSINGFMLLLVGISSVILALVIKKQSYRLFSLNSRSL